MMHFVMTSPLSFLPKQPFIFRHAEKALSIDIDTEKEVDDQPGSILIWGKTVLKLSTNSREISLCSDYDEVKERMYEFFPNLNPDEVNKAIGFCKQFEAIPYRYN
jgi:hypothetical protein